MREDPVRKAQAYFEEERKQILASDQNRAVIPEGMGQILLEYLEAAAGKAGHPVAEMAEHTSSLELTCDDRPPGQWLIQEFTRLELILERHEVDAVVMLRDKRRPIQPVGMPETAAALKQFVAHGGHYLELEFEWLADICALQRLRRTVDLGLLTYTADDEGSEAPITPEHVRQFMRDGFQTGLVQRLIASLQAVS